MLRPIGNALAAAAALSSLAVGLLILTTAVVLLHGPLRARIVERGAEAVLGRDVDVESVLIAGFGRTTVIAMEEVRVANPPWAAERALLHAPRVELAVELAGLLPPSLALRRLSATGPSLHLEVAADGRTSWGGLLPSGGTGTSGGGGGPELLGLREFSIRSGTLTHRDAGAERVWRLSGIDLTAPAVDRPVAFEARGSVAGGGAPAAGPAIRVSGEAGSLQRIRRGDLPVDAVVEVGGMRAELSGRIADPFGSPRAALDLAAHGDVTSLLDLFGALMESAPDVRVEGRLVGWLPRWRLETLRARIGDVVMEGTAGLELGGTKPMVRADLTIPKLPWPGAGETPSEPAGANADGPLIPDVPIPLGALTRFDAAVTVRVDSVTGMVWPISDGVLEATVRDGVLRIDPLRVGVADGAIRATATADARPEVATVRARVDLDAIGLDELMTALDVSKRVSGRINGTLELRMAGATLQAWSENLDGSVDLSMREGQFTTRMIDALALHIREALGFIVSRGRVRPVDCFVGRLRIEDGTVSPDAVAFVTDDMVVRAQGQVDLAAERIHLDLVPRPKRRHLLDITVPVTVRGPLADPGIEVGVSVVTELARSGVCRRLLEDDR